MEDYLDPYSQADMPVYPDVNTETELTRASTLKNVPRPAKVSLKNAEEGWLTVDVYQTPAEIVVESAVAGVNPDELDIMATPDSVSIKGERRREREIGQEDYLHQECYWGKFSRSIILPQEVDPDLAEVHFRNGILTIHLPKAMKAKVKKLRIKRPE